MGFRKGAWATVFEVKDRNGFKSVRLAISRKNKDGEYETDFSGYTTFFGTAGAKADKLKERDRIQLGDVDVSTFYDKDKNITYTNYKVFDFDFSDEVGDGNSGGGSKSAQKGNKKAAFDVDEGIDGAVDEDALPF